MNTRREFMEQTAATAAGLALPAFALANVPETVRLLSGYPPGGTTDTIARRVAERLRMTYAKNVVVDVRTGAAGQIAIAALKSSSADGSAVLVTPMASLAIYPYTYKRLPYDPVVDLAPVSLACTFSSGLAVGPAVPASVTNVQEFVAWCRSNREQSNCGSPSAGAPQHFIVEMLSKQTGVDIRHVPYRGSQPAILDMVGGQISAVAAPVGEFLQHMPGGRVRLLAVSSGSRNKFAPAVPTFGEQGFKGLVFDEWFAFYLPAKTSPEIVARLNDSLRAALSTREVVDGLAAIGLEARSSSPQELAALLRKDLDHYGPVVKAIGFTAEG